MKKLFLLTVIFFSFLTASHAQLFSENAIGLRLGDSDGFGAEISYQRLITEDTRLELDLGWRDGSNFTAFRFVGVYQWVYSLDGNFNWYVGAGGGIASFDIDLPIRDDSDTSILVAGNIGVEYDFDIPIVLSLDFRPELGFGDFNDDLDFDIALGIRYQF